MDESNFCWPVGSSKRNRGDLNGSCAIPLANLFGWRSCKVGRIYIKLNNVVKADIREGQEKRGFLRGCKRNHACLVHLFDVSDRETRHLSRLLVRRRI